MVDCHVSKIYNGEGETQWFFKDNLYSLRGELFCHFSQVVKKF